MPCDSKYLESTGVEKNASKVVQLLDELDGRPFKSSEFGSGYDDRVYNKDATTILRDKVPILCARLRKMSAAQICACSLELQLWWRDHQAADAKREREEKAAAEREQTRKAAIAKLSPEERTLLKV